jgi:hypothetical protein
MQDIHIYKHCGNRKYSFHYSNTYIPMPHCNYMPTITIYLTNELYDKIKNSPSKIVRAALEKYFKNESKPVKAEDKLPLE